MKRRKIRTGRLLFVIACFLFLGFGIVRIIARPDPYSEFKEVAVDNKRAGDLQESFDEENEEQMKFIHYPQFDSAGIDQAIQDYIADLPQENGITFVDYASDEINDRYISTVFTYQLLDKDKNIVKEQYHCLAYDRQTDQELVLSDIFRRDYHDFVEEQFMKQGNVKVADMSQVKVAPHEDNIQLNYEQALIQLQYDDCKNYIKLEGKGNTPKMLEVKRKIEIDPDKPMIAITFDDGPSLYTDEVMSLFEKYQATASFFLVGQNINNYPDSVKHMVENGFEICNHSWDHKSIDSDDKAHIRQEVFDTQDALYQLTGKEAVYIRPPYGAWNELTKQTMNDNGLHIALWNVDSEDWKNRDKEVTLQRAKDGMFDGAIMLFHDLYPSTLEAMKELIPYLQKNGYQLVTISDLFKYKGDKLD